LMEELMIIICAINEDISLIKRELLVISERGW
jgi:hypothetical protein